MKSKKEVQHVFIVGAKSLGAYGGGTKHLYISLQSIIKI